MAAQRRLGALVALFLVTASLAGCVQVETTQDPESTAPGKAAGPQEPGTLPVAQARAKVEGDWVATNGESFEVHVNRTFLLDASNSTDPDGSLHAVQWALGDGTIQSQLRISHQYETTGVYWINLTVQDNDGNEDETRLTARVVDQEADNGFNSDEPAPNPSPEESPSDPRPEPPRSYQPHVLVGVPDTGINPYHEIYYRPNLTEHPCTYLPEFPCDIPRLDLTVGSDDYEEALNHDQEAWESVRPGQWYWIPQTVFVAVYCEEPYDPSNGRTCILDDSHMHGTGTTSSVLMENEDALIAFNEGTPNIQPFLDKGIPVDIFSVSWGSQVPVPVPGAFCERTTAAIYVNSAGNDPRSTLVDCWAGDPAVISVGGAYAAGNQEEALAAKHPEAVSYYCRPTAQTQSVSEMRESYCGTSFAAPTVAGALSKLVLSARQASGYTGTITDEGMVDPELGLSIMDIRSAMNQTASYNPDAKYDTGHIGIPQNPEAPWTQWGWGFYDGWVAEDGIAYLLGDRFGDQLKPDAAQTYMETQYAWKKAYHD